MRVERLGPVGASLRSCMPSPGAHEGRTTSQSDADLSMMPRFSAGRRRRTPRSTPALPSENIPRNTDQRAIVVTEMAGSFNMIGCRTFTATPRPKYVERTLRSSRGTTRTTTACARGGSAPLRRAGTSKGCVDKQAEGRTSEFVIGAST